MERRFATGMIRAASVYSSTEALVFSVRWYAACIVPWMFAMLTIPALTLLFLAVVVGLGTAFVWMLWEMEQFSKPHRNSDRRISG
jgi:hypothetical protein